MSYLQFFFKTPFQGSGPSWPTVVVAFLVSLFLPVFLVGEGFIMGHAKCGHAPLALSVMTFVLLVAMLLTNVSNLWFVVCSVAVCVSSVVFFLSDNMLLSYISLEGTLIPTGLIILWWGGQPEKNQAVLYLLMYTVTLSVPLLMVVMFWGWSLGGLSISLLGGGQQLPLVWVALLAFLVKTPMWGVHFWLPRAHVQAPLAGSVILAGTLLKLGTWGVCLVVWIHGPDPMWDGFFVLSLVGGVFSCVSCLRGYDMKLLIAYSSVVHMGATLASLFTATCVGYLGALSMMVAHGFTSPALFFLAGTTYEATSSRALVAGKGILASSQVLTLGWLVGCASNMGIPPMLAFAGEVFMHGSVLSAGVLFFTLSLMTVIGSGAYNLFLFSSMAGTPGKYTSPTAQHALAFFLLLAPVVVWHSVYLFVL